MERRALVCLVALCAAIAGWLYVDLSQMHIYKNWHSLLNDPTTGEQLEPRQLIDLAKIIDITPEYVNQTDSLDRLYDMIYQFNLASGITTYHQYSSARDLEQSGWPVSNQTVCGQQLGWIIDKLALHPNYPLLKGQLGRELTRFMDSFGKLETGTHAGRKFWVGSYSHCLGANLHDGQIKTRYCVAKMRPKWWPQDERVLPKSRISIGICLPETCDTQSIGRHKDKIEFLTKLELPEFYKTNLIFEELYCLPDERSPLRQLTPGGRLFVYFCASWLVAVAVASIYYHCCSVSRGEKGRAFEFGSANNEAKITQEQQKKLPQPLAKLFSVQQATKNDGIRSVRAARWTHSLAETLCLQRTLLEFGHHANGREEAQPARRLDMAGMSLLKVIMTVAIMVLHGAIVIAFFITTLSDGTEFSTSARLCAYLALGFCVDAFFLLFGLLFSYNLLKRCPEDRMVSIKVLLGTNLKILTRVGPLFVFTYCFARLVAPIAGDGPWWDYGTYDSSVRGICLHESWIKIVPYFGQHGEPAQAACVGPAWFLVSYVQLALLLAPLTYLMCKLPSEAHRLLLIVGAYFIGLLQLALRMRKQTTLRPEAFSLYGALLFQLLEKFESTGTMSTLGRLGPVTIGCYVGYLLRQYEVGHIQDWPMWLTRKVTLTLVTLLQLVTLLMPTIGYYLTKNNSRQQQQQQTAIAGFVVGNTVLSLVWLGSMSVVLINCFTVRNNSALVRFAGHPFWRSFNKLGLCMYLIHFELLLYASTAHEQAPSVHGTNSDIAKLIGHNLLATLPISFVLFLTFEAPMTRLVKVA